MVAYGMAAPFSGTSQARSRIVLEQCRSDWWADDNIICLLLLAGGRLERSPSSGVDAIMSDADAEFIDALIRLLLEPVIFPFTLFLIIAAIAIIIAILNILLGG